MLSSVHNSARTSVGCMQWLVGLLWWLMEPGPVGCTEEQAWLTAQRTSGGAFLPAAAQLLAVWEAAAAKKNVSLDEFTPIYEEVAFRRPVPILQGVETIVLAVSLDLSDRFQVTSPVSGFAVMMPSRFIHLGVAAPGLCVLCLYLEVKVGLGREG
jgi:hypothetical protein